MNIKRDAGPSEVSSRFFLSPHTLGYRGAASPAKPMRPRRGVRLGRDLCLNHFNTERVNQDLQHIIGAKALLFDAPYLNVKEHPPNLTFARVARQAFSSHWISMDSVRCKPVDLIQRKGRRVCLCSKNLVAFEFLHKDEPVVVANSMASTGAPLNASFKTCLIKMEIESARNMR
ncbi:hypothetical protein EVAR_65971_1 [Eumeta japonica]|uniref:Uncharacterized protein n=1 Tax=Eumeta variegata TaxID=151549 RepID=A0A4C1Z584_EUMVA|nr:hypothetical protein EVAR_65971_1 [Eumeta japonica]